MQELKLYLQVIAQMPRYALEGIAFGGIMLSDIIFNVEKGSFNNALPILSLYVFAGYRLLPALQQIYVSFTKISFISPSLHELSDEFKNLKLLKLMESKGNFSVSKSIILKNIYYSYPNSGRTVLEDINITIPAKSTVGIVGATGSGKTTIVDIILGLLEAQQGTLEVDGKLITKHNFRSWQNQLDMFHSTYISQMILLQQI